jgi:hypothetical protein
LEHGGFRRRGLAEAEFGDVVGKSMAGGPDRPHAAGIAVFTGGLRESMIVEVETHEVDAVGARCSASNGEGVCVMRSIRAADVPIALKDDNVEVRLSEVGEMTVGYFRFAKGTDLGPALVGLPGDMCQCPHWGYMLEGTLLMRTPSGDHTYEAGQAFYWAPGHAPEALEDCAYVDFSPTAQLQEVLRHIQNAGG